MAWQFVGAITGNGNGATSYAVNLNGTLTGGIASSPAAGDLIVVFLGTAGTVTATYTVSGNTSGAFQATTAVGYSNDTWDSIHRAMFQIAGATPDTTLTVTRANNTTYGGACVVHVWRGVDQASPYIGGTQTATVNQNGAALNPPSYDPAVTDALVISGGMGAFAPADTAGYTGFGSVLSNVRTSYSNGSTADVGVIMGSALYAGAAIDPPIATGGVQNNASSSWVGVTLGFRMQPDTTPVSNDLGGTYTVNQAIERNLVASYTILQGVSKDLNSSYTVTTSVLNSLTGAYSVLPFTFKVRVTWAAFDTAAEAAVSNSLSASYTVNQTVERSLVATYTVSERVEQDLNAAYIVRAEVANNLSASFVVNQAVTKNLSASYTALNSISKDISGSYTITGRPYSDFVASYNVADPTGSVSNSFAATYTVFQRVEKTLAASYTVTNSIQKELTGTFTVMGRLTSELIGTYAVLTWVNAALSSNYAVHSYVAKDLATSFVINGRIHQNLVGTYQVFQLNIPRTYFGIGINSNSQSVGTRVFVH